MELKGDVGQALSGMDILVPQCKVAIHQPTIKDIVAYGEQQFFMAVQTFINSKKMTDTIREGNPQLKDYPEFQLLLIIAQESAEMRQTIENLFLIIFPQYNFAIRSGVIDFFLKDSDEKKKIVGRIDVNGFESFRNILRFLFIPKGMDAGQDYNPANDRAKEIAEKLRKGDVKRGKMKEKEGKGNESVFALYISSLSIGLSMDVNILYTYTPFQLYDAFNRYTAKIAYDLYKKVATTPLMDVTKLTEPDNWLDNLYK